METRVALHCLPVNGIRPASVALKISAMWRRHTLQEMKQIVEHQNFKVQRKRKLLLGQG